MIIYISMLAWVVITSFLLSEPKNYYNKRNGELALNPDILPYIAISYIIFFMGIRGGIADTNAYISSFNKLPIGMGNLPQLVEDGQTLGFAFIQLFIKTFISKDATVFLFILACIEGILIAYGVSNFSKYSKESMILFMLSGTYTWMFNGIRQFLAVSIIFAAFGLLINKKRLKYILLVLLAMSFHTTAVIMLPMCFIVEGKPWNFKTIAILLVSVAVIFFTSEFTNVLGGVLEGTNYEGATEQFLEDDGVNPLRVLANSVPAIIAFINKDRISQIDNRALNVLVNLSIMTVGMSLVAMVTSGILIGRLVMFFNIFSIISLPMLMNEACGDDKMIYKTVIYSFYALWFYIERPYYYISDVLNIYIY